MKNRTIELANGLRVVHTHNPYTRAVHCGYVINAGSRDDGAEALGMAHFIEHMIFKGTTNRKTFHILNYLESVGGDLNAYTSKEKTCVYASLASDYVDRATELLTDICFASTFPVKEIEKEKQVISEEIDMYRNAPDEAIFEDFDQFIFPQHTLGHPILGTKESIRTFTQADIQDFVGRSFSEGRMVYSIVGHVSDREVDRLVDKYLRHLTLGTPYSDRRTPPPLITDMQTVAISSSQTHEILGGRAYGIKDEKYFPFLVLNNLLGGPAMNARLNLNIREKFGLTYNISSFFSPYLDCGMWGIYYACEPKNRDRIHRLVQKELKGFMEKPLGVIRLSQAKKQLIGQLTLGYENLMTQMLSNAKDMLDFDEIVSFSSYIKCIDKVQASHLMEVANECFSPENISRLTYEGNKTLNGSAIPQFNPQTSSPTPQ